MASGLIVLSWASWLDLLRVVGELVVVPRPVLAEIEMNVGYKRNAHIKRASVTRLAVDPCARLGARAQGGSGR